METTMLSVELLVYAALAGLLGAVAMRGAMMLIERATPTTATGDMVVALGSLFLRRREGAMAVGLWVYFGAAIFFGWVYALLMARLEMTGFPHAFFAGTGMGFFHGLVVSLGLTWVVADNHPLEEFREVTPLVFLSHFAGHVVFGAVLGLVLAVLPV